MPLHDSRPVFATLDRRRWRGLVSDGRRIEQRFRAHQRHRARRFRKPLVPADAATEGAETRAPNAKSGVTRREVIFFLITWSRRYVRLSIETQHLAVRIKHRQRIEMRVACPFEKAYREYHAKLGSE